MVEERTVHHNSQQTSFGKVGIRGRSPEEAPTTVPEKEVPHQNPAFVSCVGRVDISHETVQKRGPVALAALGVTVTSQLAHPFFR